MLLVTFWADPEHYPFRLPQQLHLGEIHPDVQNVMIKSAFPVTGNCAGLKEGSTKTHLFVLW